MIRNKKIVTIVVAILSWAIFYSVNIFSNNEKILEKELNIEEEIELAEEDKSHYSFSSFLSFDDFLSGHKYSLSVRLIDFVNYESGLLQGIKSHAIPFFILFCCSKAHLC